MIQKYSPLSAGGMPMVLGSLVFFLFVAAISWGWIKSQKCLEPRYAGGASRLGPSTGRTRDSYCRATDGVREAEGESPLLVARSSFLDASEDDTPKNALEPPGAVPREARPSGSAFWL